MLFNNNSIMEIKRKKTKEIFIGNKKIGADNPILVQSMTNIPAADIENTIRQINALSAIGCDIVRIAVPDMRAAEAVKEIKSRINIPLVADIHFDYRLALKVIENDVDKLRINPGNIGEKEKVERVVKAAKDKGIPIRIGVNAGSLEKDLLEKYSGPSAQAMVESAEKHIHILEDLNYQDIVVSLKASNVLMSVEAYTLFSEKFDYPLHLGITEAGLPEDSTLKSGIGLGYLLLNGIGDTLRVSVTGDPLEEIRIGKKMLYDIGLREHDGIEIIACPTCGRTAINLIGIAEKVRDEVKDINANLKVAIMGCVVNGPGEGREADIGVAGGRGKGVLFKKGVVYKTVAEEEIVSELIKEIKEMAVCS